MENTKERNLEARILSIGGRRFVFDPDITLEQEELLVEPMNEIFDALPKPKSDDEISMIDFMNTTRNVVKGGKLRKALSLLLIPEGEEFSAGRAKEVEQYLGKQKLSERKKYESELLDDFFAFIDDWFGISAISSMLKAQEEAQEKPKKKGSTARQKFGMDSGSHSRK